MGMGKSWARGNVLGSVTKITLANTAKQISENFVVQSIMQTTVVSDAPVGFPWTEGPRAFKSRNNSKTRAHKLRNTRAQPKNQTRMVHYFVTLAEIVYTRDYNFIIHMGQVIIHAGKYFYFLCNLNSIRILPLAKVPITYQQHQIHL